MRTATAPHMRFWPKVNASGKCWLWTAHRTTTGYGRFWDGLRVIPAHRWAYEKWFGPIAEGLEIDHLCRNRACVRPTHLEAVTHLVNMGRGAHAAKTHCPQGHEYTVDNTYLAVRPPPLAPRRTCKACTLGGQHG